MRYVNEFIVAPDVPSEHVEDYILNYKRQGAFKVGEMIGGFVGFEKIPHELGLARYRIDVEAFARKDWNAFKRQLMSFCNSYTEADRMRALLEELENTGHPLKEQNKL